MMIKVIIELNIVYPFKNSLTTLLDFNNVWSCQLISGGTNKKKAIISMPIKKFKKIFGTNPILGEYEVPKGTEHFIKLVKVIKIETD